MSGQNSEEIPSGIPETGFDGVVDIYGGQALALAINVLGNRQDAEDVVQESFIQVFRNLGSYDPGRSFKTWLLTIVYRRCLDMLKKKKRFRALALFRSYRSDLLPDLPVSIYRILICRQLFQRHRAAGMQLIG